MRQVPKILLDSLFAIVCAFLLPVVFCNGRVERNVTYGRADDVELKMDVYFPANSTSNTVPAVIFIHGGAWRRGDKSRLTFPQLLPMLLRHGFLVASINYRLAPKYKFPAQIEDAKCAVRFLRAHAKQLRIDPNRIGVEGESAGGQLAALLGLTNPNAGFDGRGGWNNQSSQVEAVVDMFGPADLTAFDFQSNDYYRTIGEEVFGAKSGDDSALKRASPVNYISKGAPPFLILQGDRDETVPLKQSEELDEQLKAVGDFSILVVVKNAGHGLSRVDEDIKPSRAELARKVVDFFDHTLANDFSTQN